MSKLGRPRNYGADWCERLLCTRTNGAEHSPTASRSRRLCSADLPANQHMLRISGITAVVVHAL